MRSYCFAWILDWLLNTTREGLSCHWLPWRGIIKEEKLALPCQMTWSAPVQASCMTCELLGPIPRSLHRSLVCTNGNSVYQAFGTNWAGRAALICRVQWSCWCTLRASSGRLAEWLTASGSQGAISILMHLLSLWVWRQVFCCSDYLVGHHLTLATFFHWDVTSERLFYGWEVENCRFLCLMGVLQSEGNLLQVLVHSAEKTALVMAEVPSGGDADSRGLLRLEASVWCTKFQCFQDLGLGMSVFRFCKVYNDLQLFSFSLQNSCFLVSSSTTATMY